MLHPPTSHLTTWNHHASCHYYVNRDGLDMIMQGGSRPCLYGIAPFIRGRGDALTMMGVVTLWTPYFMSNMDGDSSHSKEPIKRESGERDL